MSITCILWGNVLLCLYFIHWWFFNRLFLFILWCFQQAKESELPGLVFSSWYQRKKARFFCSLRSEPCCRSQWEIRLWLIPGWREAEWDRYKRNVGIFHTHQLMPWVTLKVRLLDQTSLILTCYLSNHRLGDASVRQERLDLLFDHSTVPPASTWQILQDQ